MAEKKYYWLKMEEGFFNQKEIKKLRRIAGGDTYVIIYLKMSLLSLKDEGKLYFEGIEDTFIEELASDLNEEADNIQITISFLKAHNMLESKTEEEFYMSRITEMTGTETDSAKRKRKQRLRESTTNTELICDNVQKCHTEIEIEQDTKNNIQIKNKINYFDCELLPYFNDELFQESWIEFMKIRKNKKTTHSKVSMTILYNVLKENAKDLDEALLIVNKSIISGYPNLYPINNMYNKKTTTTNKWQGEQNFEF